MSVVCQPLEITIYGGRSLAQKDYISWHVHTNLLGDSLITKVCGLMLAKVPQCYGNRLAHGLPSGVLPFATRSSYKSGCSDGRLITADEAKLAEESR